MHPMHTPSRPNQTTCARGGARGGDKKGLRNRISPSCTLTQNGYGDLGAAKNRRKVGEASARVRRFPLDPAFSFFAGSPALL